MRIAGATVNQTPLDWNGNLEHIIHAIEDAKRKSVDVLCFPELSIAAYGCQDLYLGKWVSDKSLSQLSRIVPHCNDMFVAIGVSVPYQGKIYNCVAVIIDGRLAGITAKQFLAIDGVHYETRWFEPWKSGEIVSYEFDGIETQLGDIIYDYNEQTIGFEICEDAWRGKDRPGYMLCNRGVDIIMNPSASHFALGKTFERLELVENSSKDLECLYVYSNLSGNESGRMIYEGDIIMAYKGNLLTKGQSLSFKEYGIHYYDFDTENPERNEKDGTIDNYSSNYSREEEFTGAVSLALYDYLRKSKSNGFVLSLSGGADSSSCAVLVSEMVKRGIAELGLDEFKEKINKSDLEISSSNVPHKDIVKEIFSTAYQGTINSSDDTLKSAEELAKDIGARFYHWNIDEEVDSYTNKISRAIGENLNWDNHDIPLQNIQSRARSPIIWMLANIKNALLITTSNRSEGDVGYTTMDGDTSGSIAPIAGIDKAFIRNWLKFAEKAYDYPSLHYVNSLTPTAELRPLDQQQTDEDDLMPYDILFQIEKLAIRDHHSPVEVYKALQQELTINDDLLKNYVIKFFKLWSRNQWKRERIAPSFHLDTFNVDPKTWCRFPIISFGFEEEIKALEQL